jgi:hypothetical protein
VTSEQPSHFKKESKGAKAGSVLSRLVPGNDGDGAIPAARNAAADEEGSGSGSNPKFDVIENEMRV